MLGKTAGGLYWMFRGLERAENTARLIEAGFRIALTRSTDPTSEWRSVIVTSAQQETYEAKYKTYDSASVTDFLLRDPSNPSAVLTLIKQSRDNARLTRTALTRETWEAVNETWMVLDGLLRTPVSDTELPGVLAAIKQQSALVRGALHGTMLRNDIFDFCRLGTFLERADSTARILDVKYHTLLPTPSLVGSRMDNIQWEMILRSVSAHRSFRWAMDGAYNAQNIAKFLILDTRMPRSLAFCSKQLVDNLSYLAEEYGDTPPSLTSAQALYAKFKDQDIGTIFDYGLHQFLQAAIADLYRLGRDLERDYRFIDA